jgi:hypothetical protein
MTDQPLEQMDDDQKQREQETDDVLERDQEHKGYGEDEGERDNALPDGGSVGGEPADAGREDRTTSGAAGGDRE